MQLESEPAILVMPKPEKVLVKWMQPIAGVALAASVAAAAIMVAPQILDTGPDIAPQITAKMLPAHDQTTSAASPTLRRFVSAKTHTVQPVTGSVVSPSISYLQHPGTRWKNLAKPATASKLNKYLVEHSEYAIQGSMKGVVPYATFVGYDAGP